MINFTNLVIDLLNLYKNIDKNIDNEKFYFKPLNYCTFLNYFFNKKKIKE
jgi:hypothetical protein